MYKSHCATCDYANAFKTSCDSNNDVMHTHSLLNKNTWTKLFKNFYINVLLYDFINNSLFIPAKCAKKLREKKKKSVLFCCVVYCSFFFISCCQNEMNWFGKQFTPSTKEREPTDQLAAIAYGTSSSQHHIFIFILRVMYTEKREFTVHSIVMLWEIYLKNEHQLPRESPH